MEQPCSIWWCISGFGSSETRLHQGRQGPMRPLWADQRILGRWVSRRPPVPRTCAGLGYSRLSVVTYKGPSKAPGSAQRDAVVWSQTDDGCNSPSVFLQRGLIKAGCGQRAAGCERARIILEGGSGTLRARCHWRIAGPRLAASAERWAAKQSWSYKWNSL
jgi:hypothetical protein